MMINGQNILIFLYYTMCAGVISIVVNLVIGIKIGFSAYKLSRNIVVNIIGIYFGAVLGGMVGCIIWQHWISIAIGTAIGILVFVLIGKIFKKGYAFIFSFVAAMQLTYIIINIFITLIGITFSSEMEIYRNHNDYAAKNFTLLVSLLVALIAALVFGIVITKIKRDDRVYIFLCSFIGATCLVGSVGSSPCAEFTMLGQWQDFFIPFLNMEYDDKGAGFLIAIILIAFGLYKLQLNKMGKKKITKLQTRRETFKGREICL